MFTHIYVFRFVQHTARHERLDTLCGEEFQGFRGVPCGREECELNTLHNSSRFIAGIIFLLFFLSVIFLFGGRGGRVELLYCF